MTPFATLLARYRLARDWTLYDLAREAGVDRSHIYRLEHGRRTPTASIVQALARGLQLNAADTERLLLAAGFAPPWMVALADVARVTPKAVAS